MSRNVENFEILCLSSILLLFNALPLKTLIIFYYLSWTVYRHEQFIDSQFIDTTV